MQPADVAGKEHPRTKKQPPVTAFVEASIPASTAARVEFNSTQKALTQHNTGDAKQRTLYHAGRHPSRTASIEGRIPSR